MNKLFTYALATAIGLGTTTLFSNRSGITNQDPAEEEMFAANGAFRDGLYLGKLAAENGRPLNPGKGRWSTQKDRASFAIGYQRGYGKFIGPKPSTHPRTE